MPLLDWVNRNQAEETATQVPYHLLKFEQAYGDAEQSKENLIIQGDNLQALKALLPLYGGQVKCIFIDPPYNTQKAFEYYDDKLEHAQWLSMMYTRLQLIKELLADDGLFWLILDDSEIHYAKVLCDEIFKRSNFVSHIAYERSSAAGIGQGGFIVDTTEHVLCYKSNKILSHDVKNSYEIDLKTLKRYNKYLNKVGTKKLVREFVSKSNGLPVQVYEYDDFEIESISLKDYEKRKSEINSAIIENFETLFRTNQIQKENSFQKDLVSEMDKKKLYSVVYTPSRGKYEGVETELFYYNAELFSWLKDTADIQGDQVVKYNNLTNFWRHEDIPKADIANEGGVDFSRGKKPEQLLKRIFEISTKRGDLVLDSFLGSGTTAAVAHKMGRRYIGIEMGEHAKTHVIPRLEKVIEGEQGGISKTVNWQGGGGFSFYTLGSTVFDDNGFLNADVRFKDLASYVWWLETKFALNQTENFDNPFLGIHEGTAYYLLYNGILGDRRPNGGNVLTSSVLNHLNECHAHDGKRIVIGEASRLSPARLEALNIEFKQIPYSLYGNKAK